MPDKRTTIEEIVGELHDGMTIGIGGWGSRRKPMALVRAIARSSLRDLTIVSYGGPDVGLLCATEHHFPESVANREPMKRKECARKTFG